MVKHEMTVTSKHVSRVAIDFDDGSRAIVERDMIKGLDQVGNTRLDESVVRSLKWVIESIEKS